MSLVSALDAGWRLQAQLSALRAGVLSFASPKESSQRKGDPKVGAPSGFLALLGRPGGLPELACGSDKASRLPPARLRCSAPSTGTQKRREAKHHPRNVNAAVDPKKGQKPASPLEPGWFAGPLARCRATQALAENGRGLSEGRSPEFRSPRQRRVAQGTGAAGTEPGSPFLCLLSFGEAKESKTPRKGGTHRKSNPAPQNLKYAQETH